MLLQKYILYISFRKKYVHKPVSYKVIKRKKEIEKIKDFLIFVGSKQYTAVM